MATKIALLHAFFKSFPPWWDIHLQSIGSNPSIDFYYFTDLDLPTRGFPNVKVVPMPFTEIIEKASKTMGFEVKISVPYKLCDLKPAYGAIFANWLAPYEFWGHADVDVFYGDIRSWLTDDLLAGCDIASCRKSIISGQFTVYRNRALTNDLFRKISGLEELVNSPISNYVDDKWETEVVMDSAARGCLQFHGEDALVEDALCEMRGRRRLYLDFRQGRIRDVIFRRNYFMFHFIHSKSRESFLRSLGSVIDSGGREFRFFQDRLITKGTKSQWKYLIEALWVDFSYNLKRWIKKFVFRLDSSNY
jgi:hypothetical protein